MIACPHCQQAGIATLAARQSCREYPAECAHCGGLSHVLASDASGIAVLTIVLLFVVLMAAALASSWLLGVAGTLLLFLGNMALPRRLELFPIPRSSAVIARRTGWALAGAWALALFFL